MDQQGLCKICFLKESADIFVINNDENSVNIVGFSVLAVFLIL